MKKLFSILVLGFLFLNFMANRSEATFYNIKGDYVLQFWSRGLAAFEEYYAEPWYNYRGYEIGTRTYYAVLEGGRYLNCDDVSNAQFISSDTRYGVCWGGYDTGKYGATFNINLTYPTEKIFYTIDVSVANGIVLYINGVKQDVGLFVDNYAIRQNDVGWTVSTLIYPNFVGEPKFSDGIFTDTFNICEGCIYSEDEIIAIYTKGYTVPFSDTLFYAETLADRLSKVILAKGEQQNALIEKISNVISALQLNSPNIDNILVELNDFYTILRNMKKQGKIDDGTYLSLYIYYANMVEGCGETPKAF